MRKYFLAALLLCGVCTSALAAATRVPMYALYSGSSTDWFYTIDPNQRDLAVQYGFFNYGIWFYVESDGSDGAVPFRRFYNAERTEHFYTYDPSEAAYVLANGWVEEQTEGYVRTSQTCNGIPICNEVPLFRAWKNPGPGDLVHYMTTDQNQYNQLIAYQGYSPDGIKAWVYAHGGVLDLTKVAVLAYHTGAVSGDCAQYGNNEVVALRADLEALYGAGYRVVPLRMLLEWATGMRDGSDLPQKPFAVTFDDGNNEDWIQISNHPSCSGTLPSAKSQIQNYLASHSDANSLQQHYADEAYYFATSFVIASQTARQAILGQYWTIGLTSDWWSQAATDVSRLIDIQNHSVDHDSVSLTNGPIYDNATPDLGGIALPVGGNVDNYWTGRNDFCRIGKDPAATLTSARDVGLAAESIFHTMQANAPNPPIPINMPSIFAAPFSNQHPGLTNYLQTHAVSEHHTQFSMTGQGDWVTRNPYQSKYNFFRFVKTPGQWTDTGGVLRIAQGDSSMQNRSDPTCPGQ